MRVSDVVRPEIDLAESGLKLSRAVQLEDHFLATLSPEQREMYMELDAEMESQSVSEWQALIRTTAAHFPGFEAAILAVVDHAREPGASCTVCGVVGSSD
ncbi:MAG: hypothetical protein ACKVVP_03950 [Chloroflexota bacterium]